MSTRRRTFGAVSAGVLVVVGVFTSALINELHAGWIWWLLASIAASVWATGTGIFVYYGEGVERRVRIGMGGVYSGRSIRNAVQTQSTLVRTEPPTTPPEGIDIAAGGVFAAEDIDGPVSTITSILPESQAVPRPTPTPSSDSDSRSDTTPTGC